MEMELPLTLPMTLMSKPQGKHFDASSAHSRSPFMLPELDRLIASHLDRVTLANASRVCRLWHSIFNPILWKSLALQHVSADDDYDEDFNFIMRAAPPSPSLSLPSSCSSTWSAMSMNSPPLNSPLSPTALPNSRLHNLTLPQQAFLHSSQNKVLKGLARHGHLVHELKATGITEQEMAVIAVLCPSLRVLELIGGRYTADNLANLFQNRQDSIQAVRFRSCVQLRDIFQPLRYLPNLREFELYGSFVGNTITSPYFFERDLFPVLSACPQLRSVVIEQVYITDQHVSQGWREWDDDVGGGGGGGGGGGDEIVHQNLDHDNNATSIVHTIKAPSLSFALSGTQSMLSAQLKSPPFGSSVRNNNVSRLCTASSLKSLTIDCGDIPDTVIMALLARCPNLEQLSLDWSRNLSDASLLSLKRICPNLTMISLVRCEGLTEIGFKALFRNFPNLTSVVLNGNVLSDSILEELARSCHFLQHLNINSCQNITDLGIQAILLNCAFLTTLSLRFIPGLSSLMFDDIITSNASDLPINIRFSPEPGRYRRWACLETLRSLHLPDLVQPSKAILEKWQQQQIFTPGHNNNNNRTSTSQPLQGDQLIQSRLQQIKMLKHLTIGGFSLDLRVALDGLETSELETLQVTKLKNNMTILDAQWLVDHAAPRLKRLAVPNGKYLASYHLAQEGFTRLHPSTPIQPQEDGGKGVIIFRFAATMQIMRVIEIRLFRDSLPTISEIGWSPDSTMLLAACSVTGTVLVFSVEDEEFKATITVPGITSGSSIGNPSASNSNKTNRNGANQKKGGDANSKQMQALKAIGYTPPGAEILRGVRFSADSRHILIWEEHLIRLSIWSLESTSPSSSSSTETPNLSLSHHQQQQQQQHQEQHNKVFAIQHPKSMSKSSVTSSSIPPYSSLGTTATSATGTASQYAYSLRGDLQYMAIVERKECKDYISIYATEDYWSRPPLHTFGVNAPEGEGVTAAAGIKDVDGIVWSPNGHYLLVWENPILELKIAVYFMDGRCVGSYSVAPDIDGSLSSHHTSQGPGSGNTTGGGGMGVKSVCWHPGSKLVALGGYDQKIRLLNHLTWKPILEFHHSAYIKYGPSTVLWRESESTVPVSGSIRVQGGIEYTIADQPAWIPTIRIDTHKPNAKIGVGWCDFNCDGTLLASRN
ncbi:WD repeat-containing protein wrap73, partial [Entomortierella chlamydospora]